jgi:hypothetical protein
LLAASEKLRSTKCCRRRRSRHAATLRVWARATARRASLSCRFPGAGNSTLPQKINDAGDIAGYYIDSSGVTRGFVRSRTGAFSPPIVEPNDTGNRTEVRGINNLRTLCGSYLADNFSHGFSFPATRSRSSTSPARLTPTSM